MLTITASSLSNRTIHQPQREARETADDRVASAMETAQRRAEGDLRDATERLSEERERFKSQLGAAHADILRLGAEAGELERRNQELETGRACAGSGDRGEIRGVSNETLCRLNCGGGSPQLWGDHLTVDPQVRARMRDGKCQVVRGEGEEKGWAASAQTQEAQRDRGLREAAEEETNALRVMCNGLAVDLRAALEAKAATEDERQALVQVGGRSIASFVLHDDDAVVENTNSLSYLSPYAP